MSSLVRLVCDECGDFLRDITVPTSVEVKLTCKVPLCDYCRSRAVNAAFNEGQEAMKER